MSYRKYALSLTSLAACILAALLITAVPVTTAQQDSEERNREAFLAIVNEAFNQGDVNVLRRLFAPEFSNHSPFGDNNRDGAIATIEALRAAMPDLVLTPLVVIAEGEYVAGDVLFEGTFENPLHLAQMVVQPTGEPVRYSMQSIHRFNQDGQSVEEWLTWDNLSFLSQLGALPNPQAQTTDPESVIRQFYELYNAGDSEAQNALWADDATLTLINGTELQGRDQISAFSPGHDQIVVRNLEVAGAVLRWTSVTGGGAYDLEAVVSDGKIQSMHFR
ncbi:MAG: nuclear transport factor 2 family protein [Anaerolineae bacterium]|nr:nuclear transport factor 2 family protein [Anaerolineae bacterium]